MIYVETQKPGKNHGALGQENYTSPLHSRSLLDLVLFVTHTLSMLYSLFVSQNTEGIIICNPNFYIYSRSTSPFDWLTHTLTFLVDLTVNPMFDLSRWYDWTNQPTDPKISRLVDSTIRSSFQPISPVRRDPIHNSTNILVYLMSGE